MAPLRSEATPKSGRGEGSTGPATLVLEILVVVVEILDQDLEMDTGVVVDLGMAIMGMEEDLEVAILEVALVMEEEEEDMVVEDLDMATRVGATEVVMTTMEEETMVLEEVEEVGVMEGEADTELLPICHGWDSGLEGHKPNLIKLMVSWKSCKASVEGG
ncbi:hypothetical protein MC885_018210 [Smutsia gigantea]|nr:hypothetical protein MC885_018210 [Smutsia gigantea]